MKVGMKGFCQHCGKELDGNEPICPECGMPTGFDQPQSYYSPPKRNRGAVIGIAVIAVIAVLCIIGIALLPTLIDTRSNEEYTVTLTINSFRIDVADIEHQYNGPMTVGDVTLVISCSDGSSSLDKQLNLKDGYHVNTDCTDIREDKMVVNTTGDPKNLRFTVFLHYTVERIIDGKKVSISDTIDLYKVDPAPEGVNYVGTSGIIFDMSDASDSGDITLKGDSDPIGTVNLTVASLKN